MTEKHITNTLLAHQLLYKIKISYHVYHKHHFPHSIGLENIEKNFLLKISVLHFASKFLFKTN